MGDQIRFTKKANYTRDMIKYIAVMDKVTQHKPQSSDYIIRNQAYVIFQTVGYNPLMGSENN